MLPAVFAAAEVEAGGEEEGHEDRGPEEHLDGQGGEEGLVAVGIVADGEDEQCASGEGDADGQDEAEEALEDTVFPAGRRHEEGGHADAVDRNDRPSGEGGFEEIQQGSRTAD